MLGAIIGDIAGSRFEFDNHRSKEFEMFVRICEPTDDSIMTLALAKAILDCNGEYENLGEKAVSYMQELGRKYPDSGYGGRFGGWIMNNNPKPYNSFGNGSAMRVSPCGLAAESLEEAKLLAKAVTEVTHNHPEGMKGAEAVATAIFMAKSGCSMGEIEECIKQNYYAIDFTLDEIRDEYEFDETCQGSVPQAFEAFFESVDFEDTIRNAISIGGDSDTIAAIAGSIAEVYYGIPEDMREKAVAYLDELELKILNEFEDKYGVYVNK